MTKDIIVAMASTSSQWRATEKDATELSKAMDIIYNKLVELSNKSNDSDND